MRLFQLYLACLSVVCLQYSAERLAESLIQTDKALHP